MTNQLPNDFIDHPWYKRKWYELMILLHRRQIKTVCCESFRDPKKMVCCKGCALLYTPDSESRWRRFLYKMGKKKIK